MTRRRFVARLSSGAAWLPVLALSRSRSAASSPAFRTVKRTARAFGTEACLVVLHENEAFAARALEAALAELRKVEEVLSLYLPESQVCRLNRDGSLAHPHPYLVEVLRKAQAISKQSGGAFDVTVQPLWELYAAAKAAGRVPDSSEIEAARRKVDWRQVEVAADQIRLKQRGMAVTLNAVAQGFAADRLLAVLRVRGIAHALVNTGEIGALGHKAPGQPWTVGIQHPRQGDAYVALVKLQDCCLATSGDYATPFGEDDVRHHIFDPVTGQSPRELASVSIVARSGAEADALATTVFVLGTDQGLQLLGEYPGAEAFLVLKDGQTRKTPGFPEGDFETNDSGKKPNDKKRS